MSQQGGRPAGSEDDWWGQLYDDAAGDTGPAPAPDSLDDRFASATDTLNTGPAPAPTPGGAPYRPVPAPPPAPPWTSPPDAPPDSVTFPPYSRPAEREDTEPEPAEDADRSAVRDSFVSREADDRTTRQDTSMFRKDADRSAVQDSSLSREADDQADDRTAGHNPSPPGDGTDRIAPRTPPLTRKADVGRSARIPPDPPPPCLPPEALGTWTPFPASVPPSRTVPEPDDTPSVPDPRTAHTTSPSPRPETSPPPPSRGYVGARPPTYDPEPTALPPADLDNLDALTPDTVLDGARYGTCTLRAASVRGDSARYRGEPRRDALFMARFGTGERALLLVALATGTRTAPRAHLAAAEACRWIGRAVARSHPRLVDDIGAARRGDLKAGLHRLTDRSLGRLRADAAERGLDPDTYAVTTLRCLLLPADPECRTRVFFGVGPGGLLRLRDGAWQNIEPQVTGEGSETGPVVGPAVASEAPGGDRLTMDLGIPTPPSPYEPAPAPPREPFRFRASMARPGDTLLMCGAGLAEPLHGEEGLGAHLADRWSRPEPPGLAAFLADIQVRVKGYADDRTAVGVWEA